MLKTIDSILNRLTMYKVVSFGLVALLVIADVLAFAGVMSIGPVGLLVSIAITAASCYLANLALAAVLRAGRNAESWLITALILTCILPPVSGVRQALLVALAAVVAMASKYVLVWRGSHFLNPAAFGAFALSVGGLLGASWWVATPALTPFTVLLGLVVLRKQRKFRLFFAFAIPAVLLSVYIMAGLHGTPFGQAFQTATLSFPVIFLGSIMLTEPITLAARQYYQVLAGVLTGVVFGCQLHVGNLSATPQAALLVGNIFTVLAVPATGATLRLVRRMQLAPGMYDLAFERPAGRFPFRAGQYLEWTLQHSHQDIRGNRRTFSIASAPSEDDLHIGIRTYDPSSTFKRALLAMQPGQSIRAARVAGDFTLPADKSKPLVFIAGGIGITPFHSMVQELVHTRQKRDITLLYTANSSDAFAYLDDLRAAEPYGVRTHQIVGRLNPADVSDMAPNIAHSLVYVSGPDAMVSACKKLLLGAGVPRRDIKTDHFTGY